MKSEGRFCQMDKTQLIENVIEQIKEIQLKLGFAKETTRLYFPVESLCQLLRTEPMNGAKLLSILESDKSFDDTVLGHIRFSLCKGERMEVRIPAEGAAYVHESVPDPPFLVSMIGLFQEHHHLTIDEICTCFAAFNEHYVCEKMQPGADFDYVLYFPDQKPDPWHYCIRMEMGHTIYHRFTEADYRAIISPGS